MTDAELVSELRANVERSHPAWSMAPTVLAAAEAIERLTARLTLAQAKADRQQSQITAVAADCEAARADALRLHGEAVAAITDRDAALQRVAEVEAEAERAWHAHREMWQDRYDALDARTTEGMSAAEWQLRTGKAERRAREAEAALAQAQAALVPCTWTEQPDEDDFATTCGHAFQFAHDPPYDYVKICCYCGKPVVFVAAPPEKEDHDE